MLNKEEKKELEDFLVIGDGKDIKKNVKIIHDGKQYSIRIPKKIVGALGGINSDKDTILFEMTIQQTKEEKKPELIMTFIRG